MMDHLAKLKELERKVRPCVGCGWCCKKAACALSWSIYGERAETRCPALVKVEGRYWCRLVLNASTGQRRRIEGTLAIGAGCCAGLNSERKKYE
jgi:hypothetical protein